jgi:hypothetical protein
MTSQPDQFQWPVLVSAIALHNAGDMYTFFVNRNKATSSTCLLGCPEGLDVTSRDGPRVI